MPVGSKLWRARYPGLATILQADPAAARNSLTGNVFLDSAPFRFGDGARADEQVRSGNRGPDGLRLPADAGGKVARLVGAVVVDRRALDDRPDVVAVADRILGTAAIEKRPVVVTDEFGNDSIAVRQMMYLVLTYDHRVVDGADAARFLGTVKARLEEGRFEA